MIISPTSLATIPLSETPPMPILLVLQKSCHFFHHRRFSLFQSSVTRIRRIADTGPQVDITYRYTKTVVNQASLAATSLFGTATANIHTYTTITTARIVTIHTASTLFNFLPLRIWGQETSRESSFLPNVSGIRVWPRTEQTNIGQAETITMIRLKGNQKNKADRATRD